MRIKKVSQTTTTQAQIVDGYSESKIDGYSCDYVNNAIKKIYSPQERKIGIYTDENGINHDLYQITYIGTTTSSNYLVASGFTYDIIDANIVAKSNDGSYAVGYASSTIYTGLYGNQTTGNLRLYYAGLSGTVTYKITLNYIKD